MAWLVGLKSDESVVDFYNILPDFTLSELQDAVVLVKGGVVGDYSYYQVTDDEAQKISRGKSYELVWVTNEIDSVSFDLEDNKRWLKVTGDRTKLKANGSQEIVITLEMWNSAALSIITSFDQTIEIPITTPSGTFLSQTTFAAGVKVVTLVTTEFGDWAFPASMENFDNYRVMEQLTFPSFDIDILA